LACISLFSGNDYLSREQSSSPHPTTAMGGKGKGKTSCLLLSRS
jgi:hypothetical protein